MPDLPPPRARRGLRRRTLLTAVAAGTALSAGCSGAPPSGVAAKPERLSATDRLRAAAARGSERLLERYDATLTAHPDLSGRLGPLRAETARHAAVFGGASPSPSPSPSPSASPSSSGSPSASASGTAPGPGAHGAPTAATTAPAGSVVPPVPASERDALSELAAAERALADERGEALLGAPAELARVLASVVAAGAAHAFLLSGSGR
ncbi:hypothetical protein GUY61_34585 [Streptomyces sp. GC420]|nr:hypothetical protein [Streptomyces sp. GC420]